ncbi:MAG: DUF1214 domain-containing protein [Parvibaculaceae bacterium]
MKSRPFLKAATCLFFGCVLGVASAQWLVERSATAMPAGNGAWQAWISSLRNGGNPYVNAHHVLLGRLPPPAGQEMIFETERDEQGGSLTADCAYVVTGRAPGARWWQLAIAGTDGAFASAPDERISMISSSHVIGEPDGSYRITILRDPAPGNWISPGELSSFKLYLKIKSGLGGIEATSVIALPRVERGACS